MSSLGAHELDRLSPHPTFRELTRPYTRLLSLHSSTSILHDSLEKAASIFLFFLVSFFFFHISSFDIILLSGMSVCNFPRVSRPSLSVRAWSFLVFWPHTTSACRWGSLLRLQLWLIFRSLPWIPPVAFGSTCLVLNFLHDLEPYKEETSRKR